MAHFGEDGLCVKFGSNAKLLITIIFIIIFISMQVSTTRALLNNLMFFQRVNREIRVRTLSIETNT